MEALTDAVAREDGTPSPPAGEEPRAAADQMERLLSTVTDDVGQFVRQSPVLALAGAFAVGYLVAKLVRAVK
jgi:hypothetical protein